MFKVCIIVDIAKLTTHSTVASRQQLANPNDQALIVLVNLNAQRIKDASEMPK